jgi:hemoglobin/transferrin/lactoferrin receptor protein
MGIKTDVKRMAAAPTALLLLWAGGASAQAADEPAQELPRTAAAGSSAIELAPVVVREESVVDPVAPPITLKESLIEQPEINVGGSTASSQKVFVNGIEEMNLNVQIDGARQSNNVWHHNGSTLIDPQILKAVSVEAGVAPADAGPGALGGSIRYETRDAGDMLQPGDDFGAFLGFDYETNGETFSQSGASYGRSGGLEALGYVSHGEGKNYDDGNGDEVIGTGVNLLSTLAKLAYSAQGGHRIEFSGQYLIDDDVRPIRANFADVGGRNQFAQNKFERRSGVLEYTNMQPTALFDPTLRISFNESSIERPSPTGAATRIYFDSAVKSVSGLAQNRFVTPWGQLTTGLDFYEDRSKTNNYARIDEERATNVGVFAQLRTDASKPLSASAGLRVDTQQYESVDDRDIDNSGVSPNLSLRYAFTPSLALTAGYSYVFGGLQLLESALFHAAEYTYADDVDAQKARNAKLGLEYREGGLKLGAEGFRTLITNSPDVDIEPGVRHNGPDLETKGVNIEAAYDWSRARIGAYYTHAELEYGDAGIRTFAPTFGTPVGDVLKLSGAYAWPAQGLVAGLTAEFTLDYDHDDASETPDLAGYEVVNLYAEYKPVRLQALTLRIAADNLFDKDYVDRFSTSNAENLNIRPLMAQGRSFVFTTRFSF